MLPKPSTCGGCPLERLGTGFSRPSGALLHHGVLLVGEALGEEEVEAGSPFVGRAGRLLDSLIKATKGPGIVDLERPQFLVDNCIRCRPPDNELEDAPYQIGALRHCRQYLEETLRAWKPKAILAMGATATRWFVPHVGALKDWRGYIVETEWGPVIPTYHPAFLGRGNMALAQVFKYDLLKAIQVAKHGVRRTPTRYVERPTIQDTAAFWSRWDTASFPPLAFDIETPYSSRDDEAELADISDLVEEDQASYTILRISFSFAEGEAITMPWQPPFIEFAKRILEMAPRLLVWNEAFDVPRLRHAGVSIRGRIIDSMWCWHYLEPHLPYSLKYAATFCTDLPQWKHEAYGRPEYYSCVDADALVRVHTYVERQLRKAGKWDLVELDVIKAMEVLRRMSERGLQVDPEARERAFNRFQSRYDRVVRLVQKRIPLDILPKKLYKLAEETLRKKGLLSVGRWIQVEDGAPAPPPKPVKEKKPRGTKKPTEDAVGGPPPGVPTQGEGAGEHPLREADAQSPPPSGSRP